MWNLQNASSESTMLCRGMRTSSPPLVIGEAGGAESNKKNLKTRPDLKNARTMGPRPILRKDWK